MKIRHRITLWITFAGILASLVLSLIVFFEMVEEPYELLDQELARQADALISNLRILPKGPASLAANRQHFTSPYWLRIIDRQQRTIFASELVATVDIPVRNTDEGYSVNTDIPLRKIFPDMEEDDRDELTAFRVRVFPFEYSGERFVLQIARPVENFNQETVELFTTIELGLVASGIVLLLIGYVTAGRILAPIRRINAIAGTFNEKTLNIRIPLRDNRDELDELAASLNAMFDRLQYSFVRQKEFVANAAHELKTPITILRVSLEELLQCDTIPEKERGGVEKLTQTVLRMDRLVRNLLDLSALEMDRTQGRENFLLNDLVREVIDEFQPLLQRMRIGCTLRMEEAMRVWADREQLRRLFINLMDNAVKYNREGGEIRLQAVSRDATGEVQVLLFNTGEGVPAADRDKVFDQFYRVEKSRSTAFGGSGLGLTLSKRIVELHGGRIVLESKPGQWTQIDMALPILSRS
ncbi:MAG: ATP-binding protein [Desulfobulbaceae bacterium]